LSTGAAGLDESFFAQPRHRTVRPPP